jgi:hypothetical protein
MQLICLVSTYHTFVDDKRILLLSLLWSVSIASPRNVPLHCMQPRYSDCPASARAMFAAIRDTSLSETYIKDEHTDCLQAELAILHASLCVNTCVIDRFLRVRSQTEVEHSDFEKTAVDCGGGALHPSPCQLHYWFDYVFGQPSDSSDFHRSHIIARDGFSLEVWIPGETITRQIIDAEIARLPDTTIGDKRVMMHREGEPPVAKKARSGDDSSTEWMDVFMSLVDDTDAEVSVSPNGVLTAPAAHCVAPRQSRCASAFIRAWES